MLYVSDLLLCHSVKVETLPMEKTWILCSQVQISMLEVLPIHVATQCMLTAGRGRSQLQYQVTGPST